MEKKVQITAWLLVLLMMLTTVNGCGKKTIDKIDFDESMKKGEFYYYFIQQTGLYSLEHSVEEMESSKDYRYEAETMNDWYLIDEEDTKKLDEKVTRDIVAKACMRNLTFRTNHEVDIKDIEMCSDKQAVMDAVAYGLFTLENGYFNAAHDVSYTDCSAAIAKMKEIDAEGHYPEREPEVIYKDNVITIDSDQVIEYEETLSETDQTESTHKSTERAGIQNLVYAGTDLLLKNTSTDHLLQNKTKQKVVIYQPYYSEHKDTIHPGAIIRLDSLKNVQVIGSAPTIGFMKITKIYENVPQRGRCTLEGEEAELEEALEYVGNDSFRASVSQDEKIKWSEKREGVNVDLVDKGIRFTFDHTFNFTDKLGQKLTPDLHAQVTLANFAIDVDKLGDLIFKKEAEWTLKVSYDTETVVRFDSGELKYAPYNNGNGGLKWSPEKGFSGHWDTNIRRSMAHDKNSKGAEGIKIMQITVPIAYGFSFKANVYLYVGFDGTLEVRLKNEGCYGALSVKKTKKGLQPRSESGKKNATENYSLNCSLDLTVSLEPNISWNRKKLIDLSLQVVGEFTCKASLVIEGKKSEALYLSKADLEAAENVNPGVQFCFELAVRIYPQIKWFESSAGSSIVKDFLDVFKINIPSKQFSDWVNKSFHFEGNSDPSGFSLVEHCTRQEAETANQVRNMDGVYKNEDGIITLSSYKCVLEEDESQSVCLLSVPFDPLLLSINNTIGSILHYSSYVKVSSDNPGVVRASYNHSDNTIDLKAVGEGSAVVTLSIAPSAWSKEGTTVAVSVTVTASKSKNYFADSVVYVPLLTQFYT